jgi:hypothetical protein
MALTMGAGRMNLYPSNVSQSWLRLSIYPADQDSLLNPDGSFRKDALANLPSYTLMSFQSKRASAANDHKIEFTGDLTVTHVQRESAVAWSPDYSGAVPTQPVVNTLTREVTFVVDETAWATQDEHNRRGEISALATVARSGFPELVATLRDSNWPPVVLDRHCQMPYYPGIGQRDYSGAICEGSLVAGTSTSEPPYYVVPNKVGTTVAAALPSGDEIRIVVNLHLQPVSSTESGANHN